MTGGETSPTHDFVGWHRNTIENSLRSGSLIADSKRIDLGVQYGNETVDVLRDYASEAIETLEQRTKSPLYISSEQARSDRQTAALYEAISTGDFDAQAAHGIDLREVRFDLLAQTVIGRPVEFQITSYTTGPDVSAIDPEKGVYPPGVSVPALQVGQLLRSFTHYLRVNVFVQHEAEQHDEANISRSARQVVSKLLRWSIINQHDLAGFDLYIKSANEADLDQLAPLLSLLKTSPYGSVLQPPDPQSPDEQSRPTVFMPHPQYLEYAAHLTDTSPADIARTGIPLYLPGRVVQSAALAADSLTKHPQALRISVEEATNRRSWQQAAALGRLVNSANMGLSQVIYHDNSRAATVLMDHALSSALSPHIQRLEQTLGTFADPRAYDAAQYNAHNYRPAEIRAKQEKTGQKSPIPGMWQEDYECRHAVVEELYKRYSTRRFRTMYDIGCGPGISLAHIMAPYMYNPEHGGSITMVDISPDSIDIQNQWISGSLDPADAEVAILNQRLFNETGAKYLYGYQESGNNPLAADERARSLAYTKLCSPNELPRESCEVLTDGYHTCSSGSLLENGELAPTPPTYGDFCDRQKQKWLILQPGGITVGMHMVQRDHWDSKHATTQQPIALASVYLRSKEDIVGAYLNAGFINVFCKIIQVKDPHHTNTTITATKSRKSPKQTNTDQVAMAVVIAEKQPVTPAF